MVICFFLSMGRPDKYFFSDSPRFLRTIRKAGLGVETSESSCSGEEGYIEILMSEARVCKSVLKSAMNTVSSIQSWTPGDY